MDCKHERLRTVGDRVFCMECREELPLEFLITGKLPEEIETHAETVPADAERAEKQPAEEKTGKSPSKRKPRKNAG